MIKRRLWTREKPSFHMDNLLQQQQNMVELILLFLWFFRFLVLFFGFFLFVLGSPLFPSSFCPSPLDSFGSSLSSVLFSCSGSFTLSFFLSFSSFLFFSFSILLETFFLLLLLYTLVFALLLVKLKNNLLPLLIS